jgi:phosphoribosylanthranilate isomerase
MTQVKICGINSEAAFDAAVDAGADYLGFVFFDRSPRFVEAAHAAALNSRHTGGPLRVGLFVEPAPAAIAAVLRTTRLDILQIYGNAELCGQIRSEFGPRVWRALGVAAAGDLPRDAQGLDGFVIEARPPAGATRPGGNAAVMDWDLLTHWRSPAPWLLGGGLNSANVAQAITRSGAPGVDVSSGVETAPGRKSPALIHEFIAAVRTSATAKAGD